MKERYSSRKLIFAAVLLLISSVWLYFNQSEFEEWGDFIKWVFGIYVGGNIGAEASKKLGLKK